MRQQQGARAAEWQRRYDQMRKEYERLEKENKLLLKERLMGECFMHRPSSV